MLPPDFPKGAQQRHRGPEGPARGTALCPKKTKTAPRVCPKKVSPQGGLAAKSRRRARRPARGKEKRQVPKRDIEGRAPDDHPQAQRRKSSSPRSEGERDWLKQAGVRDLP